MNIDYETLESDIESGVLREQLKEGLVAGFRQIKDSG